MRKFAFVLMTALTVSLISRPTSAPTFAQAPAPSPAPSPAPAPDPTPAPAPSPAPQEAAKAVITLWDGTPVPKTWTQGFSIPLSASRSTVGIGERAVRWTVDPPFYGRFSVTRDLNRSIDVQTGVKPVTLKIRLSVAKGDTIDESSVEIQVGDSAPVPDPAPSPTPGPTPPAPQPTPSPTPIDEASVNQELRKLAAEYYAGQADRFAADAAKLAANPGPNAPTWNELGGSQKIAFDAQRTAIGKAVDRTIGPLIDPSTSKFRDPKAASAAFTTISNSLRAGLRDASK